MRITFVNVGYGDAILMESDTGYTAICRKRNMIPKRIIKFMTPRP